MTLHVGVSSKNNLLPNTHIAACGFREKRMVKLLVPECAVDGETIFELVLIIYEKRWRFSSDARRRTTLLRQLSFLQTTTDSIDQEAVPGVHCILDSIDNSYTRDLHFSRSRHRILLLCKVLVIYFFATILYPTTAKSMNTSAKENPRIIHFVVVTKLAIAMMGCERLGYAAI